MDWNDARGFGFVQGGDGQRYFVHISDIGRIANRPRGGDRVSETTLLGIDLCFGIMGGLMGQALWRHKTRKPSYVARTLLIAGLHLLWLAGLASGFIQLEDLRRLVAPLF